MANQEQPALTSEALLTARILAALMYPPQHVLREGYDLYSGYGLTEEARARLPESWRDDNYELARACAALRVSQLLQNVSSHPIGSDGVSP